MFSRLLKHYRDEGIDGNMPSIGAETEKYNDGCYLMSKQSLELDVTVTTRTSRGYDWVDAQEKGWM